jgi:haloacetate dehalogenase
MRLGRRRYPETGTQHLDALGVINADPDSWYRGDPEAMGRENYDEWRNATRNPDVVRAMLEDYRAGLSVDRQHEEADRAAGNRVRSPLLVLWSQRDDLEDLYGDPLVIWRDWSDDVRGRRIDSAPPHGRGSTRRTCRRARRVFRPG